MPPLLIPEAAQVVVQGVNVGRDWTNVFGVNIGSGPDLTVGEAQAIRDLFVDYYAALEVRRSDEWSVTNITITDIRNAGAPQFSFAIAGVVGTSSVEQLPPDMAIVHSWRANRRGGSYRGRTYHTGFTEGGMVDGRLAPDAQAAELTAALDLIDSFPAGQSLAVLSRVRLDAEPIITAVVNDVFDRQLRRRFEQ